MWSCTSVAKSNSMNRRLTVCCCLFLELYEICLLRAKDKLKLLKETAGDTDSITSGDMSLSVTSGDVSLSVTSGDLSLCHIE